jgi:arabinose-5-phosphate isomerase
MSPRPVSTTNQSDNQDITAARRVLALEGDALKLLSQSLDQSFSQAVDLLLNIKGRVAVSGMGKNSHIGAKIASTLASTGAPAQFVHPAEASHGDMGAITQDDAVIMLSNSGETMELGDLIAHTKRHVIPLIGIASKKDSMLLQSADIALLLPPVDEACPMGLAPTTSTTLMLALGDALAVALMERRGFSADDYRVLHPGGQLGKSLIRVKDIMHAGDDIPLVGKDALMSDVIFTMTEKRLGCAGVLDNKRNIVGIITDGDLRRNLNARLLNQAASEIMTKNPRAIRMDALAAEAVGMMHGGEKPITSLFVFETADQAKARSKPVGIIHLHDCLRAGIE